MARRRQGGEHQDQLGRALIRNPISAFRCEADEARHPGMSINDLCDIALRFRFPVAEVEFSPYQNARSVHYHASF